jgi:Kef-type K+ transport system membrane component KefB
MNTSELFLIAMAIIFTVPFLIWRVGRTDYWAPLVVVQIVSGILLGPGVFGAWSPDIYKFIFTPQVIGALNGLAWWAVTLFVFFAGLELDLSKLKTNQIESGITAVLALSMPLILGSVGAWLLLTYWPGEWIGTKGMPWQFILGIGMSCAVTALPILILFMEKLNILRQPIGQRILRYASLDDIAIWGVLAIILMDWHRLGMQGLFLVIYAVLAYGIRRLLPRLQETDRIYVCLIWLAGIAWGADWSGLHFMVGAFLAGAVIDSHWFDQEKLDNLRSDVLLVMMPVFFLSTGLRTSWEMGGWILIVAAVFFFVIQLVGKLGGIHLAGKILKWEPGEASVIGWLLQTKALIEIIFVNVLLDKAIITSQTFTVMLLKAVASTMITIPMVTPLLKRLPHLIKKN